MSDREAWLKKAGDVAESPVPGAESATYPLLGEELAEQAASSQPVWKVRVVVRQDFSPELREALSQGVDEVLDAAAVPAGGEALKSVLEVKVRQGQARVVADLALLRNVAEIRRLRARYSDIDTWILMSEGQSGDDPEVLVGETLKQLAGVLGGCHIVEIRQGEGESFNALWGRLNVARLMATEGELDGIPDPVSGSGLFAELEARLGC